MMFQNWRRQNHVDDVEEETTESETAEEVVEETPSPSYMTAQQVQEMMDRQAQLFSQGLQETVERYVPRQRQVEPEEEPIHAPSHEQLKAALEEGDYDTYMKLQAQRENAIYQASVREANKRVRQAEQVGMQFMADTNRQLIKTQVPDYEKYSTEVNQLADSLGLDPVTRTNAVAVEWLTNAVRGKPENIEKEFAARLEAHKRNANSNGVTPDVSGRGRVPAGQHIEQEPTFSASALQALEFSGKHPEDVARSMGYKSWDEYQSVANKVYAQDKSIPKWKRNKGGKR